MNANELRIGNLIDNNGDYFVVTPNTIESLFESERVWCKPIPLTQDWLLKLGFVVRYFNEDKNKPLMWKVEGNRHINLYYEIQVAAFVFKINSIQYSFPIKYVHQLQNLYFALTGQELTIK